MKIDPEMLVGAAEVGARRIALSFVEEALGAADRLAKGDDEEALHDLRVAVRRLRSAVRAYRDDLHDGVGRKARRALRDFARASGEARDAEVLAEWVERLRQDLPHEGLRGADWLSGLLLERKSSSYAAVRRELVPELQAALARADERLQVAEPKVSVVDARPQRSLGAVTAELIHEAAASMREQLGKVKSVADDVDAHEARIAGKRLRYLLEPLRSVSEPAKALIAELKEVQDALGELHDLHVLEGEIGKAARVDLAAMAAVARAAAQKIYERVERDWLGEASGRFFGEIDALAHSIMTAGAPPAEDTTRTTPGATTAATVEAASDAVPQEIERKYLLRGLPDAVRGAPSREIDQGYLPGAKLRERVRRERDEQGERYWRTIKLGKGVSRVEVEEPASRDVFAALWAATEGQRVRKRRYLVPASGERTWEIDDFLDRELVLAEIELGSADEAVEIPEWLAPYVVREVTDEDTYVNLNLAR